MKNRTNTVCQNVSPRVPLQEHKCDELSNPSYCCTDVIHHLVHISEEQFGRIFEMFTALSKHQHRHQNTNRQQVGFQVKAIRKMAS